MEELRDGVVFRLATVKQDFPPDSPSLRFWHFELSQKDRDHAARTGKPPRLSVFDTVRTTVAQARAIRGVEKEAAAFGHRHCGIEGLARRPGEPKALVRELRVRLADLSFPLEPTLP
jgi:hypothetical protein